MKIKRKYQMNNKNTQDWAKNWESKRNNYKNSEIDEVKIEKEKLEKEIKEQQQKINESIEKAKANEGFTGKIEEEEARRRQNLQSKPI